MVTKDELKDGPLSLQKVKKNNIKKENMSPLNYFNLSGLAENERIDIKKLTNYCDLNKNTIKPENGVKYDLIELRDIDKSIGEISKVHENLGNEIHSRKTVFKKGDILFGKLRPYLNQVALINFEPQNHDYFIGSSELIRITPKDKRLFYYLFLVMRSKFTLFQTSASHGSVRPRFNLLKNSIKLPILKDEKLLNEINSIVKKLFELRIKEKNNLKKLIRKYDKKANVKTKSDTLISRVKPENIYTNRMDHNYYMLLDMWKEIKNKKHTTLGEYVNFSTLKTRSKYNSNDVIKYITISDVDPNQGEITNWEEKIYNPTKEVSNKAPNRAKMLLKENNILLPYLKGSQSSIAWVPKELNNCISTNGFAILEKENYYGFIYIALRSRIVQSQLKLLAAGTIMEDITSDEMKQIRLYLPSENIINELNKKSQRILENLWYTRRIYNELLSFFEDYCLKFINNNEFIDRIQEINLKINNMED